MASTVSYPRPSGENRHCGYLLKLGEVNKKWKRRWCALDTKHQYLYWYTKPSGKVKGGLPLTSHVVITELGAPDYAFRVSWDGKFRDFRAESAATFPTWMKHLNDQIGKFNQRSQSSVKAETLNFTLENGKMTQLESTVEELQEQVLILEEENARLQGVGTQSEIEGSAEARIQALVAENEALRLELEEIEDRSEDHGGKAVDQSTAALMDELEDLRYHLGAAKRRIKQLESKERDQTQLLRKLTVKEADIIPGL